MKGSPKSQMARLHKKLQTEEKSRVFARLADQFRLSDHVEDAIELCQKGIEFHPNYLSGHIVLGQCYLDLGKLEEARGAFLRALALDSENLLVLKNLGDILFQQGELEEALGHYRHVLKLDPMNADIQRVVEKIQAQQRERPPTESKEEMSPVSEASVFQDRPLEQEEPRSSLAEGKEPPDEEEFSEEKKFSAGPLGTEAELSPEETELLRDKEEGGGGKGPPRGMATATLAEIYFQQGLVDKAIETYKKVLRHSPEDRTARNRLAELRALRSDKVRRKKASRRKPLQDKKASGNQETGLSPATDAQEEG